MYLTWSRSRWQMPDSWWFTCLRDPRLFWVAEWESGLFIENSGVLDGDTLAQTDCAVLKLGQIKHRKDGEEWQANLQRNHGDGGWGGVTNEPCPALSQSPARGTGTQARKATAFQVERRDKGHSFPMGHTSLFSFPRSKPAAVRDLPKEPGAVWGSGTTTNLSPEVTHMI